MFAAGRVLALELVNEKVFEVRFGDRGELVDRLAGWFRDHALIDVPHSEVAEMAWRLERGHVVLLFERAVVLLPMVADVWAYPVELSD